MQPSAQGIASLFMGNPGALAQRVDQDRKSNPMGIPDDLRQLMALNIVTTENDAAKRQQALSELNQMAPMGGQPPTVADSVRQQAQQKIQARMMQEQQKQQAMQQMLGQAQGLPAAPVEFGMAGGGIVSFEEGGRYETRADKLYRENRERAAIEREANDVPLDETARQDRETLARAAQAIKEQNLMAGSAIADILALLPRRVAGAYDTAVVRPMRAMGINAAYLAPKLTPEGASVESMTPFTDIQRGRAPKREPTSETDSETEKLKRLAASRAATRQAPPPAPSPRADAGTKGLPAALPTGAPRIEPTPDQAQQQVFGASPAEQGGITHQGVLNQAAADRALSEADYERRVGKPDRTQLDRLMAEYERQKAEAQGPKQGFDSLLEYLGQIAATPRGMRSFEAGAAGARGVQALEKERAAIRAALTEKQIGLEREQIKAERDYAKEVFGVGNQAYDRAFKANMDLFLEQGRNTREAEKMAHDKTMTEIKYQNDVKLAKIRADYEAGIKAAPGQEERMRNKAIAAYKKYHPSATDYEAMQAIGFMGAAGAGIENAKTRTRRQNMAELATIMKNENGEYTPEQTKWASAQYMALAKKNVNDDSQGGSYTVSVGGKTYAFPTQEAANKFKAEAGVK